MPTPDHPPGWYPDPLGFAEQRWWDGESWTDDVVAPHDQGPDTRDIPSPAATPAATTPAGQSGESSPTMPPTARSSSGRLVQRRWSWGEDRPMIGPEAGGGQHCWH